MTAETSGGAACQTGDAALTGLFFSEDPRDVVMAKSICAGCPLAAACLAGALARAEPAGVWGGEELHHGVIRRVHRRRGRPGRVLAAAG